MYASQLNQIRFFVILKYLSLDSLNPNAERYASDLFSEQKIKEPHDSAGSPCRARGRLVRRELRHYDRVVVRSNIQSSGPHTTMCSTVRMEDNLGSIS